MVTEIGFNLVYQLVLFIFDASHMKDISWIGPQISDCIKVILYFTVLQREVTKAGKSCKKVTFCHFSM